MFFCIIAVYIQYNCLSHSTDVQNVCKTSDNGVFAAESSSSDTPAGVKNPLI